MHNLRTDFCEKYPYQLNTIGLLPKILFIE